MTIISPLTKLFFSVLLPNGTSVAVKNAFDKLYCVLGDIYLSTGYFEDAITEYKMAIWLDISKTSLKFRK